MTEVSEPKVRETMGVRSLATQFAILALLYFLFSPLLSMPLYEKILFFPDKHLDEAVIAGPMKQLHDQLGVVKTNITFPAPDGMKVYGWYFKMPDATKTILVSHGNAGNIESRIILAAALLVCKASVVLYDYEGYGKSEGSPTIKKACEDGIAAFDYCTQVEKIKPENVIVYGESVGTGVSCQIAKARPVGGIILQSGFPSLLYAAHDRLWLTWLYPNAWYTDLNSMAVLKQPHAPLLVMQGRMDSIFPARYAEYMYENAVPQKQLALLDKVGHCLEQVDDHQFLQAIGSYLKQFQGTR